MVGPKSPIGFESTGFAVNIDLLFGPWSAAKAVPVTAAPPSALSDPHTPILACCPARIGIVHRDCATVHSDRAASALWATKPKRPAILPLKATGMGVSRDPEQQCTCARGGDVT